MPLYDQVKAEHVVPGVKALLAGLHKDIDVLEANVTPTWEGLVEPLEAISDRHQRTWGIVMHLKVRPAVCATYNWQSVASLYAILDGCVEASNMLQRCQRGVSQRRV